MLQIGQKKFQIYVVSDLNGEDITGSFYEKELQELQKTRKRIEQKKYFKEKVITCMSNGKSMIIHLIVGLIKTTLYKDESILS